MITKNEMTLSMLESGFVNITFTNDEIDCDVEEIKTLIDETEIPLNEDARSKDQ